MKVSPLKLNGVIFGGMAFCAAVACGGLIALSFANSWNMPNEALILLVGAMASSATAFIAMAVQVMQPDPWNAGKALVEYITQRDAIDFERFKVESAVVEVEDEA